MSRALIEGKCDASLTVREGVSAMENVYWPRQLAIARANHLIAAPVRGRVRTRRRGFIAWKSKLLVYGGNEQFGEYVFNFGHSRGSSGGLCRKLRSVLADRRRISREVRRGWPLEQRRNLGRRSLLAAAGQSKQQRCRQPGMDGYVSGK